MHMKVRGADDIYLQLCLGVWLNHCADTALGSDRQQLLPPSPVYLSLPREQLLHFRKGGKKALPCNNPSKAAIKIFG